MVTCKWVIGRIYHELCPMEIFERRNRIGILVKFTYVHEIYILRAMHSINFKIDLISR